MPAEQILEFYFDFGSPTAYLAHKRLQQLAARYAVHIEYKPMLLGGVFKAIGSRSPADLPAKNAYMTNHDLPRFQKRYGVAFNFNPNFPINTLPLMRGAIAAERLGISLPYIDAIYDAMWVKARDMGDPAVIAQVLGNAGIDAEQLFAQTQQPDIKADLIASTEAAVARGIFGAPTIFIGDDMYFGQDRMDFIEESLRGNA